MKIENRGAQCWAALRPTALGLAWPSGLGNDSVARTGSLADKVWRERRRKHRGSQGRAPDKEAAAVRCGGDGLMVAFEAMEVLRWSAAVG
jgi:hypothetical protein